MMPALNLGKLSEEAIREKAMERLRQMEMAEHAHKRLAKLSGGQQQLVAIARAQINGPNIVMADGPTGDVDSGNTEIIFNIFNLLVKQASTIIAVAHDQNFAARSGDY